MPKTIAPPGHNAFTAGGSYLLELLDDADHEGIPFPEYAGRPIEFARDVLKIKHLTPQQEEVLLSVRDRPITNVPAGHGIGKSFLAGSCLLLWWVAAVGGRCFTSAPTAEQVSEILWHEVRRTYDRNKGILGGTRGQLFLRITEEAQASGFTSRDYNEHSFQGKHGEKLLIILDEACGITQVIDDGALACVTGSQNRLLRIGNPSQSGTPFASACALSSIPIPVWSHPNVAWAYEKTPDGVHRLKPDIAIAIYRRSAVEHLLEQNSVSEVAAGYYQRVLEGIDRARPGEPATPTDDPILPQRLWPDNLPRDLIPGAVSIEWIERIRIQKTERSGYWQSRVDAHFPEDSEQSVVPRSYFYAARRRYDADPAYWNALAVAHHSRYGLDVGDGGDPHALARWRGPVLYWADEKETIGDREDTARAADWAWEALMMNPGAIGVDQIGVGAGTLAILIKKIRAADQFIRDTCRAFGINFGNRDRKFLQAEVKKQPEIENTFEPFNEKALCFWAFRQALEAGTIAIAPLGAVEEKIIDGFAKIYYSETPDGKTRIEEKNETRKRLGRSTNLEDAIVTGYRAPAPGKQQAVIGGQRSSSTLAGKFSKQRQGKPYGAR